MEITVKLANELNLIEKEPNPDQFSYYVIVGYRPGLFGPFAIREKKFDNDRYHIELNEWKKRNHIKESYTLDVPFTKDELYDKLKNGR